MKNVFSILLLPLLLLMEFSCGTKDNVDFSIAEANIDNIIAKMNFSCRSANPDQSLLWLREILVKAEEDKRTKQHLGNYMGKIFLTAYKNEPVVYINMAMGSGGLYAYRFDCSGNAVTIDDIDLNTFEQSAQKSVLIYSNIPLE